MINIQVTDLNMVIAFWLCVSRLLPIFIQLPLFDNKTIPVMLKVLFAIIASYAFFPSVSSSILKDLKYVGIDNFWILAVFNILLGLMIGFLVKSIMKVFESTGTIMTQHMGFASLRYFDPTAGSRIGPFEKIIQWTIIILILNSGAIIPMFKGAVGSFNTVHFYDLGKLSSSVEFYVELFNSIFVSSLMLASPIIFTNILVMCVLGIIARTVPQMNVLMISFVVVIAMGLLIFASISEEFFHIAYRVYTERLSEWFQFVS